MSRLYHGRRPGFRAYYTEAGGIYTPPNGTIDITVGTFTRSSSAMWWDGSTLTTYTTDELREPETGWVALEGSRTNYAPDWSELDAWTPGGSATITADATTAPDGDTDADLLQSGGTASRALTTLITGLPSSKPMTMAMFLKGVVGSEDFITYTLNKDLSGSSGSHTITTSWARYGHTDSDSGTGINLGQVRIQNTGGDSTDDCYTWGCTLESSAFASSPIENTSGVSTATRSADSLIVGSADLESWFLTGSWSIDIRASGSSANMVLDGAQQTVFGFSGGSAYLALIIDSGSVKVRLTDGSTTTTTGAITFSADQSITIGCDMASGDITVTNATTGDGTTSGSGSIAFPSSTDVRVGADYAGTNPYFGLISSEVSQV